MQLKKYRENKKLSVIAMADLLRVSRQHIYDIESGKAFPSRGLACRIQEVTGGAVEARELLLPDIKGQNQSKATPKSAST